MIFKILIVLLVILIVFGVAFYFLRKKASKLQAQQQVLINQHRQTVSIFVIDKKKSKISDNTFPKEVMSQFPKYMRWKKMCLVKARIIGVSGVQGKAVVQIRTFICEDKIFEKLPTGKNIKVDIAGLYIIDTKLSK